MPQQRLKTIRRISDLALDMIDLAERSQLGTLRAKLEAVVIEAARLEVDLRERISRQVPGNSGGNPGSTPA